MWAADTINGIFEHLGAFFILTSVLKLYREKKVAGIHWAHMAFFTAWGYWNLIYYPLLEQYVSTFGAVWLVLVNTIYLGQLIYYNRLRNRPDPMREWSASKPEAWPSKGVVRVDGVLREHNGKSLGKVVEE